MRLKKAIILGFILFSAMGTSGIDQFFTNTPALAAEEESLDPNVARNAYLLLKLKQYLQASEQNHRALQEKMEDTRNKIENARYEIKDLEGQLRHLEALVKETEEKIRNVETQIQEKEMDIEKSLKSIRFNEIERAEQKEALASYLRLLYLEKNLYFNQSNEANGLKILLQEGTISEVLQNGTYIDLLENHAEKIMDRLSELDREIRQEYYTLTTKRNQLEALKIELEGQQRNHVAQREGKQNLLNETKGNDEIYRELYASYAAAQEGLLTEIADYKNNIGHLDEKFSAIAQELSESQQRMIEEIQDDSQGQYAIREAADFIQLDWPVSPKAGLTAYFDDQEYIKAFGVAHQALDIRVTHGTVIFAPADGIVYKVNDTAALEDSKAKLGYGYLILAHRKGVMTLYGHIAGSLVREGEFVRRGQIIGLTGATPGTPGAGIRTTGAHLHMEVFQDGVRVDPLEYLPLEEVPLDSLSEKYLHLLENRLEQSVNNKDSSETSLEEIQNTIENSGDVDPLP